MSWVCNTTWLETASTLDAYRPDPNWYMAPATSLHGDTHATRVLVWANLLACWLQAAGIAIDFDVVRWSALLHDARRVNDGRDPAHGERAAAWIEAGGVPALRRIGASRTAAIPHVVAGITRRML